MSTRREALAARQRALLLALVAGADVPPGFDPARVGIQADALVAKRRSVVAVLVPELALADDFHERFAAYAACHPKPETGSHRDAAAYAHWLGARPRRGLRRFTKP